MQTTTIKNSGVWFSLHPVLIGEGDAYQQELLAYVDLTMARGARQMLVKTEPSGDNVALMIACLNRLLRSGAAHRILVLCDTAQEENLQRAVATIERNLLARSDSLHVSTLRKAYALLQACRVRESGQDSEVLASPGNYPFDTIVVYGQPGTSLMWRTVLSEPGALVIGFSTLFSVDTLDLFGRTVVCSQQAFPSVRETLLLAAAHEETQSNSLVCRRSMRLFIGNEASSLSPAV